MAESRSEATLEVPDLERLFANECAPMVDALVSHVLDLVTSVEAVEAPSAECLTANMRLEAKLREATTEAMARAFGAGARAIRSAKWGLGVITTADAQAVVGDQFGPLVWGMADRLDLDLEDDDLGDELAVAMGKAFVIGLRFGVAELVYRLRVRTGVDLGVTFAPAEGDDDGA